MVQENSARNNLKFVAVVPHDISEGKKYLNDINLSINDIIQLSPSSLNIQGTPTLILVDKTGTVTAVWPGKLTAEREENVLKRLQEGL
jgi:thioredoxin-related protein